MAGYSKTPLAKKLGIKDSFTIKLVNAPDDYFKLFSDFPNNVRVVEDDETPLDLIHFFVTEADKLTENLILMRAQIRSHGMIWVSWYKKSAKMQTDCSENTIRDCALKNGLVDIKVCAVNEQWSGLKLVIPVSQRHYNLK